MTRDEVKKKLKDLKDIYDENKRKGIWQGTRSNGGGSYTTPWYPRAKVGVYVDYAGGDTYLVYKALKKSKSVDECLDYIDENRRNR